MDENGEPVDKRILNVASEVSGAADNVVPRILVKLQAILDSFPQGSKPLIKVKRDIWSLGLARVALTALKQDFSKILDGWKLSSKTATVLCHSCVSLEPPDSEDFRNQFMPEALQTMLIVCNKIQNKYIKTSDILEDTKKDLLGYLKELLDAISLLCSGPEYLALKVLTSPWLLQLLIADNVNPAILIMNLIQSLNRMKIGLFSSLEEKTAHQILDELVFKLSVSTKGEMAGSACRTINVICDSHTPVVELLCKRYKGLQPLVKTWRNKGFERDLHRLEQFIEAGSMRQAELQKKHEAAMMVQAFWRSYHTRKKIKKAGSAIGTFQRSFRAKRRYREELQEDTRNAAELQHILLMRRRLAMRELRQRQLEALQILPPGEVEKYLLQEQHSAAVQIQRRWRGFDSRVKNVSRPTMVQRTRAVVMIQRGVRKWLERVRVHKREPPAWQRPPGLTDERRVHLQENIMEWRENHELQTHSKEAREELHYTVQDMIKQFAMQSRITRKKHQSRELLLARLELDAEMLMDAPKLPDSSEKDVEDFSSHSVPIATKGRYNHTQELRLLRQPWWRKLGDEYQDQKYEEEVDAWKVF